VGSFEFQREHQRPRHQR